mgnify:CR=1 FL=1
MTDTMKVIIGVLLPFLGTSLGAASVFFMKGEMNPKLQKALLGFASGVMIAASVWSLIMPGIEMAEAAGKIACGQKPKSYFVVLRTVRTL